MKKRPFSPRPISDAVRDEWLHNHLPYRLDAIEALGWFVGRVIEKGDRVLHGIRVEVDDSRLPGYFWTNRVVDAGLAHCRSTMEFLGIRLGYPTAEDSPRDLEPAGFRRESSHDLRIEDFTLKDSRVTKEQLLATGDYESVRHTLSVSLGAALHFIESRRIDRAPPATEERVSGQLLLSGAAAIASLVRSRLYEPLGITLGEWSLSGWRTLDRTKGELPQTEG